MTNESGQVVAGYEYDPYGNPIGEHESGYGYTGEFWQSELGLLHLRARWYDPSTATFLSRDTLESEHPYGYVRGNPINWIDPRGFCPPSVCHDKLGYPTDPYYIPRIKKLNVYGRRLYQQDLPAFERFERFMGYAGSLYSDNETEPFMIDVTAVIYGTEYDPSESEWFYKTVTSKYGTSKYWLGPGGFDPGYGNGVSCNPDFAGICDEGWGSFADNSGNQAFHFWFFVADAYFDNPRLAECLNFLHDGSSTPTGQQLLQTEIPLIVPSIGEARIPVESLIEMWEANTGSAYKFVRGNDSGASLADYNLAAKGIELAQQLRPQTTRTCTPNYCVETHAQGSLTPKGVPGWITTFLKGQ